MSNREALKKGLALRKKLNGRRYGKTAPVIAELAPDLEVIVNEVLFGRVWARPGLDLRMRSVATISVLIALQRLSQLKVYIGNALNAGLTKDEIIEVIIQTVFYAGMPAAANALVVAKEVFNEAQG